MNIVSLEKESPDKSIATQIILARFEAAAKRRSDWVKLWQDCYDFALPQRSGFTYDLQPGTARTERIYDATAMDAVDQLAASMLGNLTPTWSQWFGLKPGPDLSPQEAELLAPVLERAGKTLQDHFDRSNFAVEIHQCYLDLIVGGTASLFFEEAEPGSFSAFRFSSLPLTQIVLEEGESGYLDGTFRRLSLTLGQIRDRYPAADIPADIVKKGTKDPQQRFKVLEAILPDGLIYAYHACLVEDLSKPVLLASGRFEQSPVINFRWLKSPGEIYGRSPVMNALPDIKTANKVVELVLKNASIAVTGIWQADDDGVLNPANIALLADRLTPANGPRMTATEVLERSAEMALLLGATYGRLQTELLTPLILRAFSILRRRGEIPDIALDGRLVVVDYRSPLARNQGQRNVQNTLSWISSVMNMGADAQSAVNFPQAARFLGEALGVPSDLIRKDLPIATQEAGHV